MTGDRPVALVLGATVETPPPGIEAADDVLDLRYAPDAESMRAAMPNAEVLFFWHAEREELETAWPAQRCRASFQNRRRTLRSGRF